MNQRYLSPAILLVLAPVTLAFVACGSDDGGSTPNDSTGGVTGVGGAGTWVAIGGNSAATGATRVGLGGAGNTTLTAPGNAAGGTTATGTITPIDPTCVPDGACTADCSSACMVQSTSSYSCTCNNGTLDCDLSSCDNWLPTECSATATDGSDCNSATDTTCATADGTSFCFCDEQSNLWMCF